MIENRGSGVRFTVGVALKIQGKFRFVVIEFPNFSVRSLTVAAQFRSDCLSAQLPYPVPLCNLFSSLRVCTPALMVRYVLA